MSLESEQNQSEQSSQVSPELSNLPPLVTSGLDSGCFDFELRKSRLERVAKVIAETAQKTNF